MQIEDGTIVKYLLGVIGTVGAALSTLYWTIWKGDRERIKALEEQMHHAVTMPQVKAIVDDVKTDVKQDHHDIVAAINHSHEAMRSYIRDMFEAREGKWNGRNRRKN